MNIVDSLERAVVRGRARSRTSRPCAPACRHVEAPRSRSKHDVVDRDLEERRPRAARPLDQPRRTPGGSRSPRAAPSATRTCPGPPGRGRCRRGRCRRRPSATPSRSPTIIDHVVSWPCPCGADPVATRRRGDACRGDAAVTVPNSIAGPGRGRLDVERRGRARGCTRSPRPGAAAAARRAASRSPTSATSASSAALVVAGVVDGADRCGVRERRRADQIAATQLDRVDVDLARVHVDRALDRDRGLGASAPPVRRHRRRRRQSHARCRVAACDRVDARSSCAASPRGRTRRGSRRRRRPARRRGGTRADRRRACRRASRVCACPRPWCSATMLSLRVSVHRAARPMRRATHAVTTSSG